MELIFLLLTILGIVVAIIFGYLQVAVPFIKGEVRISRRFPFIETTEGVPIAKARRRKKKKRKRFLIPILMMAVIIILAVLIRILVFQTKQLRKTPIAVMTFENLTGDSSFDYLCKAIPNLIITNLERSKHLSVMTWERMHDLLRAAGKEDVQHIDEQLAFELCEMDTIDAVIVGSFTKAGDVFVTDAKVLDVSTKKILKTSSTKGEGIASILKIQIDELSRNISEINLYERTVAPTEMRIMEVTTASMDAYNYYLRGKEEASKFHHDETVKFFEKALELDSTFAMVYYALSGVYGQLREYGESRKMIEKAKFYGQKATERERLYITGSYAGDVEGDYEEQYRIWKEILRKYPKEKAAHLCLGWNYYDDKGMYAQAVEHLKLALALDPNYLAALMALTYVYLRQGDLENALECANRYALASPGNAEPFDTMGDVYVFMGNLDEAMAKYQQAVELEPGYFYSYKDIAYIYGLREDYAEALKWVDRHNERAPTTGRKAEGYWWKGLYYYLQGNFKSSLNAFKTAVDMMQEAGTSTTHGLVYWTAAWVCLEQAQFDMCREYFKQYIEIRRERSVDNLRYRCCLGLVDIEQGFDDSAKSRLSELGELLCEAESDELTKYLYDLLHVEVLLAEDSIDRAIQLCQHELRPPEFIGTAQIWGAMQHNLPGKNDLLARAYVKKGDLDKAIAEYERLITFNPESKDRRLIRPVYHHKLAVLYEQKGSTEKAIKEYERFLDIWKNADADRPEKIDAQKRLAMLKAS